MNQVDTVNALIRPRDQNDQVKGLSEQERNS